MALQSLDVFDFVVNKGHGIKGLAEMGLETVPDRYVQPLDERFDESKVMSDESIIPIIDVSNWDNDPNTVELLCDAARKYGFFQIINHGIPEEVLEGVQEAARLFFEQPTEEKTVYKTAAPQPGSASFWTSFTPNKEKVLEWKDYLHLRYLSDETASKNWPPICKDESLDYCKRIMGMAKKMYDVLLKGLNMKGYDDTRRALFMGSVALNYNYYPHCPNPELTVGIGRHSDISCLTILLQDDVGGLYVGEPEGVSWIHVPPRKGALVINIGDMMQMLSNGHYKSIEHKAVANQTKTRLSLATFVYPEPTQVVAPLPEVLASGEPAVYREVVYRDYMKYFFSKGHDGKATIDWAKIDMKCD